MFFQIIDPQSCCPYVYSEGKILSQLNENLKKTWAYSSILKSRNDIEYASLYCSGKSLEDICPSFLKTKWKMAARQRFDAFRVSLREAKVDAKSICLYDVIPEYFLIEFCEVKNEITKYVLENYKKPANYDFLVELTKFVEEIKERKLNVEENYSKHIHYNIFGAKNGRLSTFPNSFPILNFPKKDRHILKPQNDFFLSLDYIAAEVRAVMVLLEKEIPNVSDIHTFHIENIIKADVTRDRAKKMFFAWLYDKSDSSSCFQKHYDRRKLLNKFFRNGKIINPYKREIECDKDHAINYLVASFLMDIFLRQAIKINNFLKEQNAKSFISFTLHDELVIDVKREEKEIIKKCIDIFEQTDYNVFKCSKSIGKNFGEMKEF